MLAKLPETFPRKTGDALDLGKASPSMRLIAAEVDFAANVSTPQLVCEKNGAVLVGMFRASMTTRAFH